MDSNKQSFIAYRILQHPYLTSTTFLSWLQAISRKDLSMQMDGSRGIQNWYSISFCCRELTNELSQTRTRGGNLCTQFCDSDHMTCNRALDKETTTSSIESGHHWKQSHNLATVLNDALVCSQTNFVSRNLQDMQK